MGLQPGARAQLGKDRQGSREHEQAATAHPGAGKIGANTPSGFKRAVQASPDKYGDLVDSCRSFNEALGMGAASEPKVLIFDSPFGGGGVEAYGYFGVSNFNAVWDNG